MGDRDERKRILDLLAEGRVDAEQAARLLQSLGPTRDRPARPGPPIPPAPPAPPAGPGVALPGPPRSGIARVLRIHVDADEGEGKGAKVRVNVPLKLARFAWRFVPEDARERLTDQGIDLEELIASLDEDIPSGRLVEIDADEGEGRGAKIVIEVD